MSFSELRYRAGQLRRSLKPNVRPEDLMEARRILGEGLFPLFESMQPADQRHCLDVYRKLLARGCSDGDMLQAALLHDCGKGSIAGARFGARHRVAYVVLERTPGLLKRAVRYNRGLAHLHTHDEKTLALAREYGASEAVVSLIAAMDGRAPTDERARLLKQMDDSS
jgi:hypothetical protein